MDTSESRLTNELHELVLKKTTLLHQAGYVHGDLCNTNLMVRKDGQPGFMLVDFDWGLFQISLVVDHTKHHDERADAPPERGEVDSDEGHPYMVNRRYKERQRAQGTGRASRLPCGV